MCIFTTAKLRKQVSLTRVEPCIFTAFISSDHQRSDLRVGTKSILRGWVGSAHIFLWCEKSFRTVKIRGTHFEDMFWCDVCSSDTIKEDKSLPHKGSVRAVFPLLKVSMGKWQHVSLISF